MSKLQKRNESNSTAVIKKSDRKSGKWLNQIEFKRATGLANETITKYATEKNPRVERWILPDGKKLYWLPDGPKAFSLSAARKLHLEKKEQETVNPTPPKLTVTEDSEAKETINPKDLYTIDGFIKLTGLPKTSKPIVYQLIQDGHIPTVKDKDAKPKIHTKSSMAGLRLFRDANEKTSKAIIKAETKEDAPSDFEDGDYLTVREWAKEAECPPQGFTKYVGLGVFDDCLLDVRVTGGDRRRHFLIEWPGKQIAKVIKGIIFKRGTDWEAAKVLLNRRVNKLIVTQREEEEATRYMKERSEPVQEPVKETAQVAEEVAQVAGEVVKLVEENIQAPQNNYVTEEYVQALAEVVDESQGRMIERLKALEDKVDSVAKAVKNLVSQQLGF